MVRSRSIKKDIQMEECSKNVREQNFSEKSVDAKEGETSKDIENADATTKAGLMTEKLPMEKKLRSKRNAVDTEKSADNLNDINKIAETAENTALCNINTELEKVRNWNSNQSEGTNKMKMSEVLKPLKIGVSKLEIGRTVEKSEILNKATKKAKTDADTLKAGVKKKRKVMESTKLQGKPGIEKRKVLLKNIKGKKQNKQHVKLKAGRTGVGKTRKVKRVVKQEVAKKKLKKMKEYERAETDKPPRKDVIRKRQDKGVETPKDRSRKRAGPIRRNEKTKVTKKE